MSEMEDYFTQKRRELGMERADELSAIQAVLNDWYPGQVRAKRLHEGRLSLVTPSAAVANELRLRQVAFKDAIKRPELRVTIAISHLDN